MAPLVGLKMCFLPTWITNLLAIATKAAAATTHSASTRSSRHSESAEMSALRGSNAGSFQSREQAHWVSERDGQRQRDLPGPDVELQDERPVGQEAGEDGDLVVARVAEAGCGRVRDGAHVP